MGHKDYCCVPGCGNRREDKSGLSFYSIPLKSHDRYQAWLKAIGRGSDWLPTPHTRICSAHFVGGKKSNIPQSSSYIPTLALNLVQDGECITPKRRKRRSDNDLKAELGRLTASANKSDEYFRMPPTEVTAPLEVQSLIDSPKKAKSRKGVPFKMSPNSLQLPSDSAGSVAESLLSSTANDDVSTSEPGGGTRAVVKVERQGDSEEQTTANTKVPYLSGVTTKSIRAINTSSTSKTKSRTVYPIGSHVQLKVPNPAIAFSTRTQKLPAAEKPPAAAVAMMDVQSSGNEVCAILTPGGYKTVAQLLHEKRILTNPDQSICKIESITGGASTLPRREPISTTWKDVSHMERIFRDLEKFWKQKLYTDVMIKVEDETIEAHKLVVAACSPYLTSLLSTLPDAVITLHLPVKKEAMQCVITYMYSGLLKLEDTTVHDVAQTAKLLKMTKVRMLCEKFIEQHKLNKRVSSKFGLSADKLMADTETVSSGVHALDPEQAYNILDGVGAKLPEKLQKLENSIDDMSRDANAMDSQGEDLDGNLVVDEDCDDEVDVSNGDQDDINEGGDDVAMEEEEPSNVTGDSAIERPGDNTISSSQDFENLDSILDQIQADEVKSDGADVGDFISKLLNVHDEIKKESPQPGLAKLNVAASDDDDDVVEETHKPAKPKGKRQPGPFSHLCSICGWRFPSELSCAKHIEHRHSNEMNGGKATDLVQRGRFLVQRKQRGRSRVYGMTEPDDGTNLTDSKQLSKESVAESGDQPGVGSFDGIATTISSNGGKAKLAYVCCYCASKYPTVDLCKQHVATCENKVKMQGLPKDIKEEIDQAPRKRRNRGFPPPEYRCPECDFTTANRRYMPFHLYYKHDQPLPAELSKISCDVCDRKFPSKQALREHSSVHDEGGHNCKYCGKTFKYSSSLRGHIQHKHMKEKIYSCFKCSHRSKTAIQHKVHMLMHEREKPIPCPHCPYQAVSRKNLDLHLFKKHPELVQDDHRAGGDDAE